MLGVDSVERDYVVPSLCWRFRVESETQAFTITWASEFTFRSLNTEQKQEVEVMLATRRVSNEHGTLAVSTANYIPPENKNRSRVFVEWHAKTRVKDKLTQTRGGASHVMYGLYMDPNAQKQVGGFAAAPVGQ